MRVSACKGTTFYANEHNILRIICTNLLNFPHKYAVIPEYSSLFVKYAQLHELYLCGCFLGDLELPTSEANRFVEFWEALELVKDESSYGQVLVAFR